MRYLIGRLLRAWDRRKPQYRDWTPLEAALLTTEMGYRQRREGLYR